MIKTDSKQLVIRVQTKISKCDCGFDVRYCSAGTNKNCKHFKDFENPSNNLKTITHDKDNNRNT